MKASRLPPGKEKDNLLRRARLADMASQLDDWANSTRLAAAEVRPPQPPGMCRQSLPVALPVGPTPAQEVVASLPARSAEL